MISNAKDDRIRANTILVLKALLIGSLVSVALAAFSVLLQPELNKYSLLVCTELRRLGIAQAHPCFPL